MDGWAVVNDPRTFVTWSKSEMQHLSITLKMRHLRMQEQPNQVWT